MGRWRRRSTNGWSGEVFARPRPSFRGAAEVPESIHSSASGGAGLPVPRECMALHRHIALQVPVPRNKKCTRGPNPAALHGPHRQKLPTGCPPRLAKVHLTTLFSASIRIRGTEAVDGTLTATYRGNTVLQEISHAHTEPTGQCVHQRSLSASHRGSQPRVLRRKELHIRSQHGPRRQPAVFPVHTAAEDHGCRPEQRQQPARATVNPAQQ